MLGILFQPHSPTHSLFIPYTIMTSIWVIEGEYCSRTQQPRLWFKLQTAAWLTALPALSLGLVCLCYGTLAGQGKIGLWFGLSYGALLGGTCLFGLGLILAVIKGLLYQVRPPPHCSTSHDRSQTFVHSRFMQLAASSEASLSTAHTLSPIWMVLLPIVKGLGLSTILFFTNYDQGPEGLILTLSWGGITSLSLLLIGYGFHHYLSRFDRLPNLFIFILVSVGLATLINVEYFGNLYLP